MYADPQMKKESIHERIVKATQSGKIDEVLGDIAELSKTPKEIDNVMGTAQEKEGVDLFVEKMNANAKALAGSMEDQSMENIQKFLSETKDATNENARQYVLLSKVLLEMQLQNQTKITNTTYQLEDIENHPDMPPEVKAWARDVKSDVESAIGMKAFETQDAIDREKLRKQLEEGSLMLADVVPIKPEDELEDEPPPEK